MLRQLEHIPEGLLDLPAERLEQALGGPTLIHLAGRRDPALLVSVLMHGNETTGWEAVRRWLRQYRPGRARSVHSAVVPLRGLPADARLNQE